MQSNPVLYVRSRTRLKPAMALVDIRLLDHVIVGGHQTLSLAARGWV